MYGLVKVCLFAATLVVASHAENARSSPNQVEAVQLLAPSRVAPRSNVPIKLQLVDRFGQATEGVLQSFDVIVDGSFLKRVEANSAITISGIMFSDPGTHFVEVRTGSGNLRARSNPIVVQSGDRQIFWRDINANPENASLTQQPLTRGGSRLSIGRGNNEIRVAVPFIPTDERQNYKPQLVQIVAGDSQFEWLGNRFLRAGYRVGFAAGSSSPIPRLGASAKAALTAAIDGDDDALRVGATYATTGVRMVVHAQLNGAKPGKRLLTTKRRVVSGWVQGTASLDRIELVKNGVTLESKSIGGAIEPRVLKVSLNSSSAPFLDQRDLPRNGREWIGYVKSTNASLQIHSAPGFQDRERQALRQNGPERVDFITWTHGGWSSFLVQLSSFTEDEVIELSLRAGHEDRDIKPTLRPSSATPASRQLIPMYELLTGPVTREISVEGYQDTVRFELVDPAAPSYAEFSFTDIALNAEEDYYYLRILQQNDNAAWISPVIVGGFDAP